MESRKASDILLSIEKKLDQIVGLISSNDLTMKIVANKLQVLIDIGHDDEQHHHTSNLNSINKENLLPTVSLLSPSKEEIFIDSEFNIEEDKAPSGTRRTSRSSSDIFDFETKENNKKVLPETSRSDRKIPIVQRVVDKNGKSLFLAEVEILNENSVQVDKVKTNSVGKYQAQLPPGNYKIIIRKNEPLSNSKLEGIQEIKVDSEAQLLELPIIIIK
jgi:hypothetical protein